MLDMIHERRQGLAFRREPQTLYDLLDFAQVPTLLELLADLLGQPRLVRVLLQVEQHVQQLSHSVDSRVKRTKSGLRQPPIEVPQVVTSERASRRDARDVRFVECLSVERRTNP